MARDESERCFDETSVDDVRRLFPTVQASRIERLPMRRTKVFIVELIQHTVVAMSRALSSISESEVVATKDRRVEQRCVQHVLGLAQQTAKAHEVDDFAHGSYAHRRVDIKSIS